MQEHYDEFFEVSERLDFGHVEGERVLSCKKQEGNREPVKLQPTPGLNSGLAG